MKENTLNCIGHRPFAAAKQGTLPLETPLAMAKEGTEKRGFGVAEAAKRMLQFTRQLRPAPTRSPTPIAKKGFRGLWVVIGLTLACGVLVWVLEEIAPLSSVRYIPGSLLVLWLPGNSLLRVLFPAGIPISSTEIRVDWGLQVSLSIVLSIILVSVVGAALNYTAWGVRFHTLVFSLTLLTVLLLAVAGFRGYLSQKSLR